MAWANSDNKKARRIATGLKKPFKNDLEIFVALTKHVRKSSYFSFPATNFARLFKIALGANVANDTLAIELLFEAAQGLVHGLSTANTNFYWHKLIFLGFRESAERRLLWA